MSCDQIEKLLAPLRAAECDRICAAMDTIKRVFIDFTPLNAEVENVK